MGVQIREKPQKLDKRRAYIENYMKRLVRQGENCRFRSSRKATYVKG
jgi:hypothetical protein